MSALVAENRLEGVVDSCTVLDLKVLGYQKTTLWTPLLLKDFVGCLAAQSPLAWDTFIAWHREWLAVRNQSHHANLKFRAFLAAGVASLPTGPSSQGPWPQIQVSL